MPGAPTVPVARARFRELAQVGRALRSAGYTPAGLAAALGTDGPLVEGATLGDRRRRSYRAGVTGFLARLLLLGDSVAFEECPADVEPLMSALLDVGLVTQVDGSLLAAALVVPHDDLLVAADRIGVDTGADVVPGVQPPSHLLGCLTVRLPVERALDLGTGCGIQSLLLAPLAERVVATDLSERALAYAELNAALNAVSNIEFRLGSLYEPVAGERFGLVVANPPYVISPDRHFTFRDSELGGEQISQEVVRRAPSHLVDGGHASVLVSWAADTADVLSKPSSWVGDSCDALVLGTGALDAEHNAERWNVGPDRDAAVNRWIGYFEDQGITQVGYGAVVLRRRSDGARRVRALQIGDRIERPASAHLLRMLDSEPLGPTGRVTLVPGARISESRALTADRWSVEEAELRMVDGLGFRIPLDAQALHLVSTLDARGLDELSAEELAYVDQLVTLGFAEQG